MKHLDSIREKYFSLDRIKVFESNFGNYARNKIKCFIEDNSKEHTLWSILQELFSIWRRTHKIVDSFVEENGSELIARNLFDGISSKWDTIVSLINNLVSSSDNPFVAAKSLGKMIADFSEFVQKEGDEHILQITAKIKQKVFSVLSDDFSKYITSMLLCTINKITSPEKSSRHRHTKLWPYLEEIQSTMRDIVNEARLTYGTGFSAQIVPSFEHGIREINSLLQNQDILNIKPEGIDIRKKKTIQENTEDKVSAICVMGSLLNMIDDINDYIRETMADEISAPADAIEPPRLIGNAHLLETLTLRVVGRKIESIANTIIFPMEEEMRKLTQKQIGEENVGSGEMSTTTSVEEEQLSSSLPSFSIAPHNYVTGIGHGLLSQMNTIGGYGSDRNFVRAISSAVNDTNSVTFNEEEADLWLLTEIAKLVQNVFCSKIGNVEKHPARLRRQFNADILFLMEALADLRLQPTAQLAKLAEKLKEK